MINGTCSLCGGLVETPDVWFGVIPPVPYCRSCGAQKKLPVVEMDPNSVRQTRYTISDGSGKVIYDSHPNKEKDK